MRISKIISLVVTICLAIPLAAETRVPDTCACQSIVSVICHGIKNDGNPIGSELNALVMDSYGKTLYFPAGTYTLSEPIVLPFDYTKNVNIIFDHNALLRSDVPLEALLKVGFSEMSTQDRSQRRFSFIEGGKFDCSNAENGIIVNGLKQLVSLRSMSLFKGRNTHIRVGVTDDFKGTGSSDTKMDNITIQGISSNDEVYGIVIDEDCADIKISNSFIYGTKYGITTKSPGHILNNVHILSQVTTGGTDRQADNFVGTEGIRIESNGFFILNEIYYDTIDKCIFITDNHTPALTIDKNIFYSYLENFGRSFIHRDSSLTSSFRGKISNSIFHLRKGGYKIFDFNPSIVGYDTNEYFTFVNNTVNNPYHIDPYDASLLQKTRKKNSDALIFTNQDAFDTTWHVIGNVIMSPFRSKLRLDLGDLEAITLDLKFNGSTVSLINSEIIDPKNTLRFELAYTVKDGFCVLLFRPKEPGKFYPVISDLLGNGSYMSTPSKDKHYRLADYALSGSPTILLKN